jgi:hypothetical protein
VVSNSFVDVVECHYFIPECLLAPSSRHQSAPDYNASQTQEDFEELFFVALRVLVGQLFNTFSAQESNSTLLSFSLAFLEELLPDFILSHRE